MLLFGKGYCQNIYYVNVLQSDNTGNGLSWGTAFKDLQYAINQATAGDEIWVAKGTYLPTNYLPGASGSNPRDRSFFINKNIKVYGGFIGIETHPDQRDIKTNPTILSADFNANDNLSGDIDSLILQGYSDNAYHVVVTSQLPRTAEINGFTIKNGNANGENNVQNGTEKYFQKQGGGIFNWKSKALFKNITFTQNRALLEGGAVYDEICTDIEFDSCTFQNNFVYYKEFQSDVQFASNEYVQAGLYDSHHSKGGAIYHRVGNWSIKNSLFEDNFAATLIRLGATASTTVTTAGLDETASASSEAQSNSSGGAVYATTATGLFLNNRFRNNIAYSRTRVNATSGVGASIGNDAEAKSYVDGYAGSFGGACSFLNPAKSKFLNCFFEENKSIAKVNGYASAVNETYSSSANYPDADGLLNSGASAGAIEATGNAGIIIEKCFFYKNSCRSDADQYSYILNSGAQPSSVDADARSYAREGAVNIANTGADTVKINYNVFAENSALSDSYATTSFVSDSYAYTLSDARTGALGLTGHFRLDNNTFTKNRVFADTYRLGGSTGSANISQKSSAIFLATKSTASTAKMNNSIVWGNTGAAKNLELDQYANRIQMSHNILEGSGGSTAWIASFGLDSGSNLDIDPVFIDTMNVLGPDQIAATVDDGLKLSSISPAINSGVHIVGLSTDILGVTVNGIPEIGAYEFACTALDQISLNSTIFPPGGNYEAISNILASSHIDSGSIVSFKAGNFIQLNPGFETKTNVVFSTSIQDPCSN